MLNYARNFLRWWWLIAIPTLVVAALSLPALLRSEAPAGGGYTTRFRYSAAQNLDAIPRTEGDYQDIWLSSELTVNALTDWVTSSSFADEVSQRLAEQGITIDAPALIGSFASDNERSVGEVYIRWSDEAQLNAIAQAAVWALTTRSAEYFAQLGGTPAFVTLLDAPRVAPAPPPLADRLGPAIRIGLGLLFGLGLALAAHLLDPLVHSREDIEGLGIPVITSIPRR